MPAAGSVRAAAWWLGLSALLGGCGFHLRSYDVGTDLSSAYVASNPRNLLEQPLRDALRQAGVEEAPTAADAEVVLELLDSRQERRNVSFSGQARVAEYEAVLRVRYRIRDAAGNELAPDQWLERQRVYRVDSDNIVGSSEEQALLEQEMQRDLVQSILRTLNTVVQQRSETGDLPGDLPVEAPPAVEASDATPGR